MLLTSVNPNDINELVVKHNDQELLWDARSYSRFSRDINSTVFNQINQYWEQLDPEVVDKIFKLYQEAHEVFETTFNHEKLTNRLKVIVKNILDLHPDEDLMYWIKFHSELKPPSTLKSELGPNDPPERTYLKDDYWGLILLGLRLRPIAPIWAEYLNRIVDDVGSIYKEYIALSLIADSDIVHSQALTRLQTYINVSLKKDSVTTSSVLNGMGSTELPEWLLSLVLVRKIAIVDVSINDEKNSIISAVYRVIRNSTEGLDRKFKGVVSEKRRVKDGTSDDDNSSLLELYKIKQPISDGDLMAMDVYVDDLMSLAVRIDETVPSDLVYRLGNETNKLESLKIMDYHIAFMQWCLSKAISARAIPLLNKPTLLSLLGLTKALLLHWGFPHLAIISTSTIDRTDDDDDASVFMETRTRIPKECGNKLAELYPYYQNRSTNARQSHQRLTNPATIAVEALSEMIPNTEYRTNVDISDLYEIGVGDSFFPPPDLRTQLAWLIINYVSKPPIKKQPIEVNS